MLTDLKEKYSKLMGDLEKDLKNKEDLEYVKEKVNDVFMMFMDEIDAIADKYEDRMQRIAEQQLYIDNKVKQVEKTIATIEKDIYLDEEEYDFQIVCPYCNYEFVEDFDNELKKEVKCPECNNIIELDWNNDEEDDCGCNCGECLHDCTGEHEDIEENDDEDM